MSADTTSRGRPGRHRLEVIRERYFTRGRATGALLAAAIAGTAALTVPAMAEPPQPEMSEVARQAYAEPAVPGTPCSISTRACVDLETQEAWLIRDGKVTRGPMKIASGGENTPTPVGHSNRVYRKEIDHVSGESNLPDGRPAPMPFTVFFADGGIAFHAGDPARSSAGCIRMERADAEATFNDLQMGDKVQVVNGSVARKHRAEMAPPPPPPPGPAPAPAP